MIRQKPDDFMIKLGFVLLTLFCICCVMTRKTVIIPDGLKPEQVYYKDCTLRELNLLKENQKLIPDHQAEILFWENMKACEVKP